MSNDGTGRDGQCVICGRKFTMRYYIGDRGPFCGDHIVGTHTWRQ